MRKHATIRWVETAVLLLTLSLVMVVPLAPYVQAKYVSEADTLVTGINAVSNDDLNDLLKLMMNERYPVGSIYMTTDITSDTAMGIRFGGAWDVWAQGKVPVGVNTSEVAGVIHWDEPNKTGGDMAGGDTNNATVVVDATISPNVVLNNKSASWTGGSTGFNAMTTTMSGPASINSGSISLASGTVPSHSHPYTLRIGTTGSHHGGDDKNNTITDWGTNASQESFTPSSDAYANNGPDNPLGGGGTRGNRWGVWIYNRGSGTAFTIPFAITPSRFSATIAATTYPLNHQTITIPQQTVTGSTTAKGSQDAKVPNATIQPYVTCYIYVRRALA